MAGLIASGGYQGFPLSMSHFHKNFIAIVIDLYGLELDGHQVDILVATWLKQYDNNWIIKAIVESLYRGRYKIVSVDHILRDWQRLGRPRYNFTPEYEREILQNLPAVIDLPSDPVPPVESSVEPAATYCPVVPRSRQDSKLLDPEESAPFQYRHQPIPAPPIDTQAVERSAIDLPSDLDLDPHNSLPSPSQSDRVEIATESQDWSQPANTVAQPIARQLFNTLKAIVDPKNHHRSTSTHCVVLPVEVADRTYNHQFNLPIENIPDRQQL
jgi:hypothetical protein